MLEDMVWGVYWMEFYLIYDYKVIGLGEYEWVK